MSARLKLKRRVRWLRRQPWYVRLEAPVLGLAIWSLLWLLRWTTRYETVGLDALESSWREGRPVVLAFWHGRSIMLPFLYRDRIAQGRDVYIMNSPHRDGEIITRSLERFGITVARGSSSRGAVAGARRLLQALLDGNDVALVPDGPRGPGGVAKAGAVELAASAGAPLCPLAFSASRAVRLPGWDRMMLPLPGARVVCVVGDPIRFEGGRPDRSQRERWRVELEARLCAASRRADREVGRPEEDQ